MAGERAAAERRIPRGVVIASVVAAWLLARPTAADAHLMAANRATLNVVGESVFAVVSVPVSALHGFDDDGDGLLSMPELERHQDALKTEIDRRFVVSDGDDTGTTVRIDLVLSPQHDGAQDRSSQVVALEHTRFSSAPRDLGLLCDLFGARDGERSLELTATRHTGKGAESEPATLTPEARAHRFFAPATAAPPRGDRARHASVFALALAALCASVAFRRKLF
jgi:hypothetical protein